MSQDQTTTVLFFRRRCVVLKFSGPDNDCPGGHTHTHTQILLVPVKAVLLLTAARRFTSSMTMSSTIPG